MSGSHFFHKLAIDILWILARYIDQFFGRSRVGRDYFAPQSPFYIIA